MARAVQERKVIGSLVELLYILYLLPFSQLSEMAPGTKPLGKNPHVAPFVPDFRK